ncbi:uncharacterized protein LOC124328899 isoform X2 [Daphnia pulicaria]|uniref:uncharacterized protein LOC124328899 isoform X2 n=1 Tax=Daphnia pulicaria TaxID=35523 RepID=UPI001EEAAE1D|nr:uncharacterized protein LOC124328899 isoform X2 [Daphnia pulicaria]
MAPVQVPRSIQPVSSSSEKALDTAGTVPELTKRKSSSWMIQLTLQRAKHPFPIVLQMPSTHQTSSLSTRSRLASRRLLQTVRFKSIVPSALFSVIRSSSLTLPRWSVTSSLLGNDSSSRSVWDVSKEPYKKERVQQLLDKRGWSVVSFRHWRSLGHQMQDLKVPEEKSASVKSIQTGRSDVPSTVEGSVCASPTLLKDHFEITSASLR